MLGLYSNLGLIQRWSLSLYGWRAFKCHTAIASFFQRTIYWQALVLYTNDIDIQTVDLNKI